MEIDLAKEITTTGKGSPENRKKVELQCVKSGYCLKDNMGLAQKLNEYFISVFNKEDFLTQGQRQDG